MTMHGESLPVTRLEDDEAIGLEADAHDEWLTLWDRLEVLGVVSHPDDDSITLVELRRIASVLAVNQD